MIKKGVILAGGEGTRLRPLTKVTSKQLLPVYDRPLIYFPLHTLLSMGITDILIITAPDHVDDFISLLGSGRDFNARFEYAIQEEANGIAAGLQLGENFVKGDNVALILGDNIFFDKLNRNTARYFKSGAQIFATKVKDPERFGVVEIKNDMVVSLEEKPEKPKSKYAQTGLYFYDTTVFEKIKTLKASPRGELEITDLNNLYLTEKSLKAKLLKETWLDAGTFESLFHAGKIVRKMQS